MKIGIITDSLDDNAAGIGVYIKELLNNLKKIDHQNTYVLIHHTNTDNQIYRENEHLLIPFKSIIFKREIRKIIELPRILEKNNFDIVHEPTQIGPFFFKSKFTKVVTILDLTTLKYPKTHKKINYIRQYFGMPIILKNVDKVIVPSRNTKKDLIERFKVSDDKVEVIYMAISGKFKVLNKGAALNKIKQKYNLPSKFILNVSTLEPRKNIPTLVRAYHKLKKNYNLEHRLVIVGGLGWKYAKIFNTIRKLDLDRDVIFTGYVPDNELLGFYNTSSLFVYPSIYEGFGLPPLEAMACGTPVITSNTSSLPEVVGDAGITVSPYDIEELAKTIYQVLTDEKLKQDMIEKGLKRAKMFSWKKTAQETLKVYESL